MSIQLKTGEIYIRETTRNSVKFLVMGREEYGVSDPDPIEVFLTPESVKKLQTIDAWDIRGSKSHYKIFQVFHELICWRVINVYEGWGGNSIRFEGPYLISLKPPEHIIEWDG